MVPQARPQPGDLRVLVIEDEVLIRLAIAEELRFAGLTVVETVSADEAWAYLEAGGHADLVFSDICMPGSMNGLDFARRLKTTYPEMIIILTSGNCQSREGEWLGLFLPKPYDFEQATKFVLEALDRKAQRTAAS
ncbi:MAG: response regulator [Methylovirgula sp.]